MSTCSLWLGSRESNYVRVPLHRGNGRPTSVRRDGWSDLPLRQLDNHTSGSVEKHQPTVGDVHDGVSRSGAKVGKASEGVIEIFDAEAHVVETGPGEVAGLLVDLQRRVVEPQELHFLAPTGAPE